MKTWANTPSRWIILLGFLLSWSLQAASPVAGTRILNQATGTYKDANGTLQTATSNIVSVLIRHVASVEMINNISRIAQPDSLVYLPHAVTNTGNDDDSYLLQALNLVGDDYDFIGFNLYVDADQNGLPDNSTAIASTPELASGQTFYFIIAANVPAGAQNQTANLRIKATSQFSASVSVSNTDTVEVRSEAVINVSKSISANSGHSPSGSYTVILAYNNSGAQLATNLTLIDALPAGMSYVPNSARWSVTGENVILTDADPTDAHAPNPELIYCAYDASCVGLAEAKADADSSSTNQITAIINEINPGESGSLRFEVTIDAGLSASVLLNTAEFEYNDDVSTRNLTNTVPFEIQEDIIVGVVGNGSTVDNTDLVAEPVTQATVNQGATISFDNIIWNTGNTTDSFDMTINTANNTFPAGTIFSLYYADGATPLMDTNSNGIADTGPIIAGSNIKVILKASLPASAAGDNAGAGFDVIKIATSAIDPTISNTITDHLDTIISDHVDLTNSAALGEVGVLGAGTGPEAAPLTTKTIAPGDQATFVLYVNNQANSSRNYPLSYSKDKPFVTGTLDIGWNVTFYEDGGASLACSTLGSSISSTGAIAANTSKLICAVVSVPAQAAGDGALHPIYFKVYSDVSNVSDIKYDAVLVAPQPSLTIAPDHTGQTIPGSTVVYQHTVTNTGNTPLDCLTVNAINSSAGWSSLVYLDVNTNGLLDGVDVALTPQTLPPGSSFSLLLKVFSPANASLGTTDIAKLILTGHQDTDSNPETCENVALTDTAQAVTTVNPADVNILKQQAPDADCDGIADSIFVTTVFSVEPGGCLIYRLIATNASAITVNNVRIDDKTPEYTVFNSVAGLPTITPIGNITGGANGTSGLIVGGSVGGASISLQPGETLTLEFGARLE